MFMFCFVVVLSSDSVMLVFSVELLKAETTVVVMGTSVTVTDSSVVVISVTLVNSVVVVISSND